MGSPPRHAAGATGPAERRQQRLRVAVGNRHHRNLGEGGGILERQPFGILGRADSRRERIARIDRHIHDAAALHAVRIAAWPRGEHVALNVAVVARVGIDEAADGAVLGRDLGLDAAPGAAVARDHDRSLHRNAQPVERFVISRHCRSSRTPAARSRRHRSSRRYRSAVARRAGRTWGRPRPWAPPAWP